jgi:head-tail adaptor
MKAINPGEMRQRLTLMTLGNSTTTDGTGQDQTTYTTVGTYYAKIEPLRGMELYNASQTKGITYFKVTMRNVGPIKPTDQLVFETDSNRVLNIESVYRVDERNAYYSLVCAELIKPQ